MFIYPYLLPTYGDTMRYKSFTDHVKKFNPAMDWIGVKTGPLAKQLEEVMEKAGGAKVKQGSIKIVCEFE